MKMRTDADQVLTVHLKVFEDIVFLEAEVVSLGFCLSHLRTENSPRMSQKQLRNDFAASVRHADAFCFCCLTGA